MNMKTYQLFLLLGLLLIGGYIIIQQSYFTPDTKEVADNDKQFVQKKQQLKKKQVPAQKEMKGFLHGELYEWLNKSDEDLISEYGDPDRKDESAYGYTWWVYTNQKDEHTQFGIKDNQIVTVFATGEELSLEPLAIGQSYQEIDENFTLPEEVNYEHDISFFTFRLNEEDLKMRPLIQLADDLYIQLYFDTITDALSSVRIMNAETLLLHRFYEIEYRGSLPDQPSFSNEEWEQIEEGMENQIFDLTNLFRHRYDQSSLHVEVNASEVAFMHSKDMAENNYFSHYSQNGDGLKERLEAQEVYYIEAGENIAAQYSDAPAAMEGWLNSESHREALLKEEYTHLGVGVYRQYYTQNFLAKP